MPHGNIVDNFIEFFNTNPLHRTNRYSVTFTQPALLGGGTKEFYADSVVVPGRSLATVERRSYGPQKDLPYERLFSGDLDITFVLTEGGSERVYFEGWMNKIILPALIYDRETSTKKAANSIHPNRSEYVGELNIKMLGSGDWRTHTEIEVYEVYPKSIGTINLSQAEENEYVKLPVSFSFREYAIRSQAYKENNEKLSDFGEAF